MSEDIQRRIREKISEIEEKSASDNYIYRGEPKIHEKPPYCGKISSSLWREYHLETEGFDIEAIQMEMLNGAKKHIGDLPQDLSGNPTENLNVIQADDPIDFEILTEIQHYGGKTNLIDFTIDYFIALFFACDGYHDKDGRIILQNFGEIKNMINHPRNPRHRVIAQKSVFVRPPKGFIVPHEDDIVTIPGDLKQWILHHLRKYHGISTETIYNDLYGYIRSQHIHGGAYTHFYRGFACQERGDEATDPEVKQKEYEESIKHYAEAMHLKPGFVEAYYNCGIIFLQTEDYKESIAHFDIAINFNPNDADAYNHRGIAYYKLTDYKQAIADYTKAIQLKHDLAEAYHNRGETRLHLEEWDGAKADLTHARDRGMDIIVAFNKEHGSVEDFQSRTGIIVPGDIAEMLTNTQS